MKYKNLIETLYQLLNNRFIGSIDYLNPKSLELSITNNIEHPTRLFLRFNQYKEAIEHDLLINLFKLLGQAQNEHVFNEIKNNIDVMEELTFLSNKPYIKTLECEGTTKYLNECIKECEVCLIKSYEYDCQMLKKEVGENTYKIIKDRLKPNTIKKLIELHQLMTKFSSNINENIQQIFILIAIENNNDIVKLCYNLFKLIQIRNLDNNKWIYIYNQILMTNWETLYNEHQLLLKENKKFEHVIDKLDIIENNKINQYNYHFVCDFKKEISSNEEIKEDELDLYVVLNNNKFKNKKVINISKENILILN